MKYRRIFLILAVFVFFAAILATASSWDGDITDSAAESLAKEGEVGAAEVLPWKIEGDLLLFLFLLGGAAAGFAAGYYWRKLFSEPGQQRTTGRDEEAA